MPNDYSDTVLISDTGISIGIDLGTTTSIVSYFDTSTQKCEVIKVNNQEIIPSAVFFKSESEVFFGEQATRRALRQGSSKSLATLFKRKLSDRKDKIEISYDDSISENDSEVDTIKLSGEEISTLFLAYLKEEAEKKTGQYINKAVITVPANFTAVEIEATKSAAESANFEHVRIEKEPTAAAVAYGLNEGSERNLLVYDFGGGTFDVSIISLKDDVFDVLYTDGDNSLGGEELTTSLLNYIYEHIQNSAELIMFDESSSNLNHEHFYHNKVTIYKAAERAKIDLSDFTEVTIDIPNIYISDDKQTSIELEITRSKFNNLIKNPVEKTIKILERALTGAQLTADNIDTVILVGGSSKIPLISEKIESFFNKPPENKMPTQTVVSIGAAILASIYWDSSVDEGIKRRIKLLDKTIHDFGVAIQGRIFDPIINAGIELPASKIEEYSLVKDYQATVNVEIFQRKQAYSSTAVRTLDEGIDFLDNIVISELPPIKQSEGYVKVELTITQEYIIDVQARVLDNQGNLLSKDLKISKQSRSN